MPEISGRLDSRLEQEGAEFLVLAHLLLEKIEAHKAYTRYPGYDIVALNRITNRQCRVQVKSRWATDYNRTFPLKGSPDCDFVVLVALNRGYRYEKPRRRTVAPEVPLAPDGRSSPRYWVFPKDIVIAARNPSSKWGIVPLSNISELNQYENAWRLISDYLEETGRV